MYCIPILSDLCHTRTRLEVSKSNKYNIQTSLVANPKYLWRFWMEDFFCSKQGLHIGNQEQYSWIVKGRKFIVKFWVEYFVRSFGIFHGFLCPNKKISTNVCFVCLRLTTKLHQRLFKCDKRDEPVCIMWFELGTTKT